jgi:hypothetical protein
LIKLMSMISLTIAPLIAGRGDWENWFYGVIPIVFCIIGTIAVYMLYWSNVVSVDAHIEGSKV